MSNWQDIISETIRLTGRETAPDSPFQGVLDEVVAELNKADFFRVIRVSRQVGALLRMDVLTYPRRLPAERSVILVVTVGNGYVSVPTPAGMGYLNGSGPEDFREYLVQFFSSDGFRATLQHYRTRNAEPVQGWLRKHGLHVMDLEDQAFVVSPAEQDKIVDAFESQSHERVELMARIVKPVGNFQPYRSDLEFSLLESGGFVMADIVHESVREDTVRVIGTPRYEGE